VAVGVGGADRLLVLTQLADLENCTKKEKNRLKTIANQLIKKHFNIYCDV
jgi:hypothetical protein